MEHRDIMDLARKGALMQKQERYRELCAEIASACATIIRAATIMMPGRLEEIQEDEIEVAGRKLKALKAEALALKAELERAGIHVW